jgi:hypothetical protein
MAKRKREVVIQMSKFTCTDVSTDAGKNDLQKSVANIIKQNKKVFDNLAKS